LYWVVLSEQAVCAREQLEQQFNNAYWLSHTLWDVQLGCTAVHYAAVNGNLEALTLLLEVGARTDVRDKVSHSQLVLFTEGF